MFFLAWGWSRRATQLGVVGLFTCGRCQWSGTSWLLAVERRLPLYWVPVGPWRAPRHAFVRRNCGHAADVPEHSAQDLVATARSGLRTDPFGPEPVATTPAAVTPVA